MHRCQEIQPYLLHASYIDLVLSLKVYLVKHKNSTMFRVNAFSTPEGSLTVFLSFCLYFEFLNLQKTLSSEILKRAEDN